MSSDMILGIVERDDLGEGIQQVNLPWGHVIFGYPGKNGICICSTEPGDPPEMRFVAADGNSGKWSFCVGDPNNPGSAVEVVMVQGKIDERVRDRPDIMRGCLTVHLQDFRKDPSNPRDDGIYNSVTLLPDYAFIRGLDLTPGREFPVPPPLVLPPIGDPRIVRNPLIAVDEPTPVPPDPDADLQAWLADDAKHRDELDAIAREFATASGEPLFVPDDNTREAYRSGRNRNLKSIHDDMVQRFGSDPGPCQWKP